MARGPWALTLLLLACPGFARAEDELSSLDSVHAACEAARDRAAPVLYALEVDYRIERHDDEAGRLFVDTRRNLRALGGHVSLLLSGLEPVAFEVSDEEAAALRQAAEAGARLRVGFFLGLDDPGRQPCVLRGAHAVTIVRADLAYAELSRSGERLARAETDRLRAWREDQRSLAIPGEGPRGAVGVASFDNAQSPPESWQRALRAPAIGARLAQCHAEGVARGASSDGQVVVRLNVEVRSGRVRRADVSISSIGDAAEGECIARAVGSGTPLPAGPASWNAEVVDLSVPVRLTAD